jgi:hypothetical protein
VMSAHEQRYTTALCNWAWPKGGIAMEWFWGAVSYACLAAIGAFGLFTMLYWFEAAAARRARVTAVNARKR